MPGIGDYVHNWFNVRDYGARGDRNGNDTPAIQQALLECSVAGGGLVIVPDGNYALATSPNFTGLSNVTLWLMNGVAITGSGTFPTSGGTNCGTIDWRDGAVGPGFAAPGLTLGTANSAGAAATTIRSDATIAAFDATVPTTSAVGDAAGAGAVAVTARRDHRHGREAFGSPASSAVADSASDGVAATLARSDHRHGREASITNANLNADVARANQLVNGGLEVWPGGTGPFTVAGAYFGAMWAISLGAASTISISRDNTNNDAGSGFCAAITYTHSAASEVLQQLKTEALYELRTRTVSLSMRVKTATAGVVRAKLTDGTTISYSSYHSGSGAYQTLTVPAFVVASAPTALNVSLSLEGTATVYLDSVMLTISSVAADYQPLTPDEDLARCLRYHEIKGGQANDMLLQAPYANAAIQQMGAQCEFQVRKAVTPTVTKAGTWFVSNSSQPSVTFATTHGFALQATSVAAGGFLTYCDSVDDLIEATARP